MTQLIPLGLDLVELQIRVAEGVSLAQVGLANGPSRKSGTPGFHLFFVLMIFRPCLGSPFVC